MSDAKKCDRCGAFYNELPGWRYKVVKNEYPTLQSIDLCNNCNYELEEWLKKDDKK